jgi:hypothetical protein
MGSPRLYNIVGYPNNLDRDYCDNDYILLFKIVCILSE